MPFKLKYKNTAFPFKTSALKQAEDMEDASEGRTFEDFMEFTEKNKQETKEMFDSMSKQERGKALAKGLFRRGGGQGAASMI
tara:strand:+ start:1106 stop:1351 length:246 start_codon:yes stop_codon:yes gene_type:complete